MTEPVDLLTEIADVRANIARVEADVARITATFGEALTPLKQREQELRDQLHPLMQASGQKTIVGGGLMAQDVVSSQWKVVDETHAYNALSTLGLLDECLVLDRKAVEKIAKTRDIAGVEPVTVHTLRITKQPA